MDPSVAETIERHLPATNAFPTTAGGSGAAGTAAAPRVEAERPMVKKQARAEEHQGTGDQINHAEQHLRKPGTKREGGAVSLPRGRTRKGWCEIESSTCWHARQQSIATKKVLRSCGEPTRTHGQLASEPPGT